MLYEEPVNCLHPERKPANRTPYSVAGPRRRGELEQGLLMLRGREERRVAPRAPHCHGTLCIHFQQDIPLLKSTDPGGECESYAALLGCLTCTLVVNNGTISIPNPANVCADSLLHVCVFIL